MGHRSSATLGAQMGLPPVHRNVLTRRQDPSRSVTPGTSTPCGDRLALRPLTATPSCQFTSQPKKRPRASKPLAPRRAHLHLSFLHLRLSHIAQHVPSTTLHCRPISRPPPPFPSAWYFGASVLQSDVQQLTSKSHHEHHWVFSRPLTPQRPLRTVRHRMSIADHERKFLSTFRVSTSTKTCDLVVRTRLAMQTLTHTLHIRTAARTQLRMRWQHVFENVHQTQSTKKKTMLSRKNPKTCWEVYV